MFFSVIVPCYNEGEKIANNVQKIKEKLDSLDIDYNIVIVNDGSKDNTQECLNKINIPSVYVTGYPQNAGKGHAVRVGAQFLFDQNIAGDYINFMDADLATDLSAIDLTLKELKSSEVVIGSRKLKESVLAVPQGPLRRFIGKCCSVITRIIIGIKCNDMQCGFKTFKKEIMRDIINKQTIDRFAFDVEYLYIAKLNGAKIKEIPVIWSNDSDSKVSVFVSSLEFIRDLLIVRKNKKLYMLH